MRAISAEEVAASFDFSMIADAWLGRLFSHNYSPKKDRFRYPEDRYLFVLAFDVLSLVEI